MYKTDKNRGAVKAFINKNGGLRFINKLMKKFKTLTGIVVHFQEEYDFYCTTRSINNYIRTNEGKVGPHGGDRKSKEYKQSVKPKTKEIHQCSN